MEDNELGDPYTKTDLLIDAVSVLLAAAFIVFCFVVAAPFLLALALR